MMKIYIPLLLFCLLLAACAREEEPEPQATTIGIRPKEASPPALEKTDSIDTAGAAFERSASKTRQRFNQQEKIFTKKDQQFESKIRTMTDSSKRLQTDAKNTFEQPSRSLESEMATKKNSIQTATQKK